jgi:DNA-binding response OmpR family regulator
VTIVVERPRVLVVDDNRLAHQGTLLALRVAGYPAIAVATPADAVAAVEVFRPRVVLLEWAFRDEQHRSCRISRRMHDVAGKLRMRMSVIVVSHLEPTTELLDADLVELYLVKPVSFDVIEAAIEHVLTGPMCAAVLPPGGDSRS